MSDAKQKYSELILKMDNEIKQVDKKAQRAMRVTLWMKIILTFASVAAVGAWLKNHGAKELWAIIILGAKIADVMLDTLPYMQQRITLPQLKIKLVDIYLEVEQDLVRLEREEITEQQAMQKFYDHRNAWIKSLS